MLIGIMPIGVFADTISQGISNLKSNIDTYASNSSESYLINNKNTGRFMKLYTSIILYSERVIKNEYTLTSGSYDKNSLQNWTLELVSGNRYYIKSSTGVGLYGAGTTSTPVLSLANFPSSPSDAYLWEKIYIGNSDEYKLRNVSNGGYLIYKDGNIKLSSSYTSDCIWRICKVSDFVAVEEVVVENVTIAVGETVTPILRVIPSNATWADIDEFELSTGSTTVSVSSNFTVTSKASGSGTVSAKHRITGKAGSFTVSDNLLENGTYYIKNADSGKTLEQESTTTLIQNFISGATEQKMKLNYEYGGFYTISVSFPSVTALGDYYLSSKNGISMSSQKSGLSDSELWMILPTSSGYYKIIPKTNLNNCIAAVDEEYDEVESQLYINDKIYNDEWRFIKQYDAVFIGVPDNDGDHNHHGCYVDVENYLKQMNYSTFAWYTEDEGDSLTAKQFLELMEGATIFIVRGHAGYQYVKLNGVDVTYNDIYSMKDKTLGNLKLVIYCACEAGKYGENGDNMVNITYEKGAKTVIGFKDTISCDDANQWTKEFFHQLSKSQGQSIDQIVQNVEKVFNEDEDLVDSDIIKNEYIVGGNKIW